MTTCGPGSGGVRRAVALVALAGLLAAGLSMTGSAAAAVASDDWEPPAAQEEPSVEGTSASPTALDLADDTVQPGARRGVERPVWPKGEKARVKADRGQRGRAGGLPVWVTPRGKAKGERSFAVEVFDRDVTRAAGVRGLLVQIRPEQSRGPGSGRGDQNRGQGRAGDDDADLALEEEADVAGHEPDVADRESAAEDTGAVGDEAVDEEDESLADETESVVEDPDVADEPAEASDAGEDDLVEVSVSYEDFAEAYGGDWASRLTVRAVDDCLVDDADAVDCDRVGESLEAEQDYEAQTLTFQMTTAQASGSTLMVTGDGSSEQGDYTASDLAPSALWNVSLQTGDFSWSYPMAVPPSVNGPAPSLAVGYSSGSVDGRTSGTNNQTSWLGEGHQLGSGFIERRYVPCLEDQAGEANNKDHDTGDLCWHSDNATIAFGDHAGELVQVGTSDTWRLKNDDGSKVERKTGAPNGVQGGEHWVLTTPDGTQYWFGKTRRYSGDETRTNSVAGVPVFGNHPDEPCYEAEFADSHCVQGLRWHLDYVVDVNNNTMSYFYQRETNRYGLNRGEESVEYHRATRLRRIEYGTRKGSEDSGPPPARVVFDTSERCIPTDNFACAPGDLDEDNAHHWPDVPYDLICDDSNECDQWSPSFFTRKRLTAVRTQIHNGTSWVGVDRWNFEQSFPAPGDGTSRSLWLKSIQHTALAGPGEKSMPKVEFAGTQMHNRVNGLDGSPPMIKYRVSSITSETGGGTSISYSARDCADDDLPGSKHHNGRRCFPAFWTPEWGGDPEIHWFHKYVVTAVYEIDSAVGGDALVNRYTYHGNPAWRYSEDKLTRPKYKTWNEYRGYRRVTVTTGDGNTRTRVSHRFLRGMHDDRLPDGERRDVTRTDSWGNEIIDRNRFNGFTFETQVFNGADGPEVSSTRHRPVMGPVVATDSDGVKARGIRNTQTQTRTALESGGDRVTTTNRGYDEYGYPTQVADLAGPGAADDLCTRTTYNRNLDKWILNTAKTVTTTKGACSTSPSMPDDLVSSERYFYDGNNTDLEAAPTRGRLTKVEDLYEWGATGVAWRQLSRMTYDNHGRLRRAFNALDELTETVYTPASGAIPTTVVTTNPAGHQSTTHVERRRGLTTAEVDPNGRRTDLGYDHFGRLTDVWMPGRAKNEFPDSPNLRFSYRIRRGDTSWVKAEELLPNGTHAASYAIFDSLLRQRQTQGPAVNDAGGRVITHTDYDSRGLVTEEAGPYYNTENPSGDYFAPNPVQVPAVTRYRYDGAGRQTHEIFRSSGEELWRTVTTHGGDRVHTRPPAGGVPTTTVTDARGQMTELRRYHGETPSGAHDKLTYAYTPGGQLASVTDPGGQTWSYSYDLAGRQVEADDPDAGLTMTAYDELDRVVTSTDAESRTLWHAYDVLGRSVENRADGEQGELLRSWSYDSLPGGLGLPSSASTHASGGEYVQAITGYDPAGRPTGSAVTIPEAEGELAGTYEAAVTYNLDGSVATQRQPNVPGLPSETMRLYYKADGMPRALSGRGALVSSTTYSAFGEVLQYRMSQRTGRSVTRNNIYESGTRRLVESSTWLENHADPVSRLGFAYDDAGNILSIVDAPGGGLAADRQCFETDHVHRLVQAWTAAGGDCDVAPSPATVSSAGDAYWHSWSYDDQGNRAGEVRHGLNGADDVTRVYGYEGDAPHAVTSLVDDSGPSYEYTYDAAGNLTSRKASTAARAETYEWDHFGRMAASTDVAGARSEYVYGPEGDRLIRRAPDRTTLYVGSTEVTVVHEETDGDGGPVFESARYYQWLGETIAVRTSEDGVRFVSGDHQGTASVQVDAVSHEVFKQRSLPFGGPRGSQASGWSGEKGFVGGTIDTVTTGLTHIGAREYDPDTGRFISVDPILDPTDPRQMNGYAYANHSPVTYSDPTGLFPGPMIPVVPGPSSVVAGPSEPSSGGSGGATTPPYVPHVTQDQSGNAAVAMVQNPEYVKHMDWDPSMPEIVGTVCQADVMGPSGAYGESISWGTKCASSGPAEVVNGLHEIYAAQGDGLPAEYVNGMLVAIGAALYYEVTFAVAAENLTDRATRRQLRKLAGAAKGSSSGLQFALTVAENVSNSRLSTGDKAYNITGSTVFSAGGAWAGMKFGCKGGPVGCAVAGLLGGFMGEKAFDEFLARGSAGGSGYNPPVGACEPQVHVDGNRPWDDSRNFLSCGRR